MPQVSRTWVGPDGVTIQTAILDTDTGELTVTDATGTNTTTADPDDLAATTERIEARERRQRLDQAADVLEQWAADARTTTVTNGNNRQVTQVMVDRLGMFFDRFADLLRER